MSTPVTVHLFAGSLACPSCGQGVPDAPEAETMHAEILGRAGEEHLAMLRTPPRPAPIAFRTCATCRERRDAAQAIVSRMPRLAARFGSENARHRLTLALDGLAALGQKAPDPATITETEVGALLRHLTLAGGAAQWKSRFVPVAWTGADPTSSAAWPWAALTDEQRATLREGYGGLMAERVARTAPPVRMEPPEGRGCLLCGIGHVTRPAAEVVAHGGREAMRMRLWRFATASTDALGGARSPDRLRGCLCPTCDETVSEVGAIGMTALERAFEQHLRATGRNDEADAMRREEIAFRLIAWGALDHRRRRAGRPGLEPNVTRWEHLLQPE